jgi:hypothetical protein
MAADQLFRLVDLAKRVFSGRNSAAMPAAPVRADKHAPLVQSNILEARVKLTSERTLRLDNKSLFDTVPFA